MLPMYGTRWASDPGLHTAEGAKTDPQPHGTNANDCERARTL